MSEPGHAIDDFESLVRDLMTTAVRRRHLGTLVNLLLGVIAGGLAWSLHGWWSALLWVFAAVNAFNAVVMVVTMVVLTVEAPLRGHEPGPAVSVGLELKRRFAVLEVHRVTGFVTLVAFSLEMVPTVRTAIAAAALPLAEDDDARASLRRRSERTLDLFATEALLPHVIELDVRQALAAALESIRQADPEGVRDDVGTGLRETRVMLGANRDAVAKGRPSMFSGDLRAEVERLLRTAGLLK